MPRGPRIDAPGILHHVMARGIERREVVRSDGDREELLDRLGAICAESKWSIEELTKQVGEVGNVPFSLSFSLEQPDRGYSMMPSGGTRKNTSRVSSTVTRSPITSMNAL